VIWLWMALTALTVHAFDVPDSDEVVQAVISFQRLFLIPTPTQDIAQMAKLHEARNIFLQELATTAGICGAQAFAMSVIVLADSLPFAGVLAKMPFVLTSPTFDRHIETIMSDLKQKGHKHERLKVAVGGMLGGFSILADMVTDAAVTLAQMADVTINPSKEKKVHIVDRGLPFTEGAYLATTYVYKSFTGENAACIASSHTLLVAYENLRELL
jgi:hypothetical protein